MIHRRILIIPNRFRSCLDLHISHRTQSTSKQQCKRMPWFLLRLISCYSSTFSQPTFYQNTSVSLDSSVTSSPPKVSNEVTGNSPWPAYVKTDLRQATRWLNQDMDEAARLLHSPRSQHPCSSRTTNSGSNTNQQPRLGTVPGQSISWLADFDNPLTDSDTLGDS
jgi:hypothetical protein